MREDIDDATRATLDGFGFDRIPFEELRERLVSGALSVERSRVRGRVEPPRPGDIEQLPAPGAAGYTEAREAGLAALGAGKVASVVLAGGMATRFGGVVKGTVEALDGRSFLEWKLGQTAELSRALGSSVPTVVMTSFQTDAATREHVAARRLDEPLWFSQFVSLRLTPTGGLFRDDEGRVSLHGPGHGDLVDAMRVSGVVDELTLRGVDTVVVSNVDNLGARLDPVLIGAHLLGGAEMTTEVARKDGDTGGAPVRVDGKLQLLEGPRFPLGFDQDTVTVFNTNTATFRLDVFTRTWDLSWLVVEKLVEGRPAVQLERLYHELSAFVPTRYLEVPRHGPRGRFFPIKTPDDLVLSRDLLREMLAASVLD